MKKMARLFTGTLCGASMVLLLIFAKPVSESVRGGMDICLRILIPSLFAFMVFADFSVKTGLLDILLKPFGWICGKIFHIDCSLGSVLIMSMLGGYPVGAKLITDLVTEGKLGKNDAERMLCFCVNSGPAFVVGSVAVPLFGDPKLGFVLFASHLTAFFTVGMITGIGRCAQPIQHNQSKTSYSTALVNAVHSATRAMLNICSFVLVFSAVIGLLRLVGAFNLVQNNPIANALLVGVLEVTNGTNACSAINGSTALLMATALTAFGGLCVQMQIIAIVSKANLSMKPFFLCRFLYVAVSTTTAWIILQFCSSSIPTLAQQPAVQAQAFTFSPMSSVFLIILCVLLLLSGKKSGTIESAR